MASTLRRATSRICLRISAERNNRSTLKQYANHGKPLLLGARSVAGCTNECCKQSHLTRCWKCNAVHVDGHPEFFCKTCEIIQPPGEDVSYFEIMDSPETFLVDIPQLQKMYRDLQFRLHPDRFSKCTPEEQNLSALHSSIINKAYNTLLKPLSRGKYLLKQHGISVEQTDTLSSPEFLMEIMEINESLEDAKNLEDIKQIETWNTAKINECTQELANLFENGNYSDAKDKLIQLRYYINIENQIKDRKTSMDLAGEH
ncbi:iron-sulfur cluster co-chaperone protein HscB [Exaiptasia diaphana]|uniref:J domain-containing protein n=1 Tax=Exaiptasia diaphana TaxID=2652724 RepID=A0A913YB98_EXADI|nr:iron-sulfur cluster co-chaperone protein HscB [Exaiptasia diaphana]KXJ21179.1 Iron-sulfur cluster co-chaperone protein HscB, mitochondrial [Exaiptasia diaphana]